VDATGLVGAHRERAASDADVERVSERCTAHDLHGRPGREPKLGEALAQERIAGERGHRTGASDGELIECHAMPLLNTLHPY
jgi:hypothetical protein